MWITKFGKYKTKSYLSIMKKQYYVIRNNVSGIQFTIQATTSQLKYWQRLPIYSIILKINKK